MTLDAHLRDDSIALRQFGHAPHFVDVMGQWLLAIDMFAELHGTHADGRVHVVWGGNIDGINVFGLLVKQFAPVLIVPGVGKPLLCLDHPRR